MGEAMRHQAFLCFHGVSPNVDTVHPQRSPYGTERSFNGLRLAKALQNKGETVSVFLVADAVSCA